MSFLIHDTHERAWSWRTSILRLLRHGASSFLDSLWGIHRNGQAAIAAVADGCILMSP